MIPLLIAALLWAVASVVYLWLKTGSELAYVFAAGFVGFACAVLALLLVHVTLTRQDKN